MNVYFILLTGKTAIVTLCPWIFSYSSSSSITISINSASIPCLYLYSINFALVTISTYI